jgi:hypothetical protein
MNQHQYTTGGNQQRDMVSFQMARDQFFERTCFGAIGQMILVESISGPIDAPIHMPAGGMNSIEYTNGAGKPVPYINTVSRD